MIGKLLKVQDEEASMETNQTFNMIFSKVCKNHIFIYYLIAKKKKEESFLQVRYYLKQ